MEEEEEVVLEAVEAEAVTKVHIIFQLNTHNLTLQRPNIRQPRPHPTVQPTLTLRMERLINLSMCIIDP